VRLPSLVSSAPIIASDFAVFKDAELAACLGLDLLAFALL